MERERSSHSLFGFLYAESFPLTIIVDAGHTVKRSGITQAKIAGRETKMIVLSEDLPRLTDSPSARSLKAVTNAAQIVGCHVYHIPQEEVCPSAEDALAYVPVQKVETPGAWVGYIPSADWYAALYATALRKGIRLLNTPDEHLDAQEFDRAYARLGDLTPTSVIVTDVAQCAQSVERLGLPVFVKGAVQSRKSRGWKACVAETLEELEKLCAELLLLENRSRGRVVVRQLARLRASRISAQGFPFGREYRVFLYNERVLAWGYYWEGDDPLKPLSREERRAVLQLAQEAARRVGTPFLAVDIGQKEDGGWIVIETGDAQFSGVSQTPLLSLWNAIRNVASIPEEQEEETE